MRRFTTLSAIMLTAAMAAGCDDKPNVKLAPTATGLASSTAKVPAKSVKLTVNSAESKVQFVMNAPLEKIIGRVNGASSGSLVLDPSDLTKTTGLFHVDLGKMIISQQAREKKDGDFGKEEKKDAQNEHARNWLEIGEKTDAAARKKNEDIQFSIKKVTTKTPDVSKLTGASRKVMLTAAGEFFLHGRKTEKTLELEATFTYDGDTLKAVGIKSTKPFSVGLAEHDVHPRDAVGGLLKKTLSALGEKVGETADITIDVNAAP